MKSILVIGLGKFGEYLSKSLAELGNEVMVLDTNETDVHDILPYVSDGRIGDSTREEVLRSIGVSNYDIVFVCIDSDFRISLETTFLAKELGAKYVVSKTDRPINEKFLLHNGADEVIFPNKDIATKVARKYTASNIFDYIELNDEYGIYELPIPVDCIGKSIKATNFRAKYHANILAIKKGDELNISPSPDYVFEPDDHLMIMGQSEEVKKYLKVLDYHRK